MTGPGVVALLREDLRTIRQRDPSVRGVAEAVLHPSFTALALHRLCHRVHLRGHRITARLLAMVARTLTQIEIHPGARIGRRVFIDHGAAVVIGETAEVGDDVTLFHQVTLGSVGWWHDAARPPGSPRHPRLEDGAVLGCGATVLGPVTVGRAAVIGANALVVRDVPPAARVLSPLAVVQPATPLPGPAALPTALPVTQSVTQPVGQPVQPVAQPVQPVAQPVGQPVQPVAQPAPPVSALAPRPAVPSRSIA